MDKQIKVLKHGTNEVLATISPKDFSKWCDANGYLPHHKFSAGWVVI